MQVRFFNIPIRENEQSADDLNGFLRGHRVLELREQFVNDGSNSCWCLMVKYLEGTTNSKPGKRGGEKVDYTNPAKNHLAFLQI